MKHKPYALLLAGFLLGAVPNAFAQIVDDEASQNFLAIHCAVSGGGNAADYADYCRGLAKTVGLLNPTQQERVFGFVPQPGASSSIPDYNPDLHGALGTGWAGSSDSSETGGSERSGTAATESEGEQETSANESEGEPASANSNSALVDAIGNFNEALNGNSSGPGAIVGGTPPSNAESEEPAPNEDSSGNWLEGLFGWLRDIAEKVEQDMSEAGIVDESGKLNRDAGGNVIDGEGNLVFKK